MLCMLTALSSSMKIAWIIFFFIYFLCLLISSSFEASIIEYWTGRMSEISNSLWTIILSNKLSDLITKELIICV